MGKRITILLTLSYIYEPNSLSKRVGKEVIIKSIKIRGSINLPRKLYLEVIEATYQLYNISLLSAYNYKTLLEVLNLQFRNIIYLGRDPSIDLKPNWSGIYIYSYRAYPLNKEQVVGRDKRGFKVNPRGYIGYLVGYRALNIYRIQILILDQVITTRNITFNKLYFYEGEYNTLLLLK